MDSAAFLCPNCGTIRWATIASKYGVVGFTAIIFTAGLVMIIIARALGNPTASMLYLLMCGFVNVVLWAFVYFSVLDIRDAYKTRGEILAKNDGIPFVELKVITQKEAPSPVRQAPPVRAESTELETIRQAMLQAEKDALNIKDFDEAAKALTDLYNDWIQNKGTYIALVGGFNYIDGKKDACFCINQYLQGNKDYGAVQLRNLIAYHEGFPRDIFHCGSMEIIKWGYERTITDLKIRGS
jgi:hypothetical protein